MPSSSRCKVEMRFRRAWDEMQARVPRERVVPDGDECKGSNKRPGENRGRVRRIQYRIYRRRGNNGRDRSCIGDG